MSVLSFIQNRNSFSHEELQRHVGQWVAFDEQGLCIVGAAHSLDLLEKVLAESQIDPQSVHFEYLPGPEEDAVLFSPQTKHEVPLSE